MKLREFVFGGSLLENPAALRLAEFFKVNRTGAASASVSQFAPGRDTGRAFPPPGDARVVRRHETARPHGYAACISGDERA